MKAKVLAALAATMAVSATCAFAANPFVDVPTDSWAYKSVVELADAGVIQGVDGEYFQGQRNITRYEAAEMVAKAMAHMDKASVEQRALINKLADEYADELNNLGVRVSNLENKVGNVKFTGDGRLRYRYQGGETGKKNDNSWDYRIRLRGAAQVNERTTATLGVTTNNHSFGENGSAQDDQIAADIIKVDYNFGGKNWLLSLGRDADWKLGGPRSYAYQYGDTFDRAELKYQNDNFAVTAGYGKFKEDGGNLYHGGFAGQDKTEDDLGFDGLKMGYGEIEAFFGNNSAAGVYYSQFNRSGDNDLGNASAEEYTADNLWGVYANVNIGSKWNVLANYESIDKSGTSLTTGNDVSDPDVWIGRVMYGKASMAQPKSWDIWVEYIDAEDGAWLGGSTGSWRNFGSLDNMSSWGAGIDYVIAKNLKFSFMQSFATDMKDTPTDKGQTDDELTRAEITFAF
ncbi:S-layer homology domain-containing protein [Megasphaera sp. An286]|uniref:S-layer homology domain-containing protein n=1 Tax=Megasphaera sp. An286 TaxID=1965622 RepID=UPI000B3BC9B4|nr:S-layer homology domain-containing protein [Megasphaera sp. An286]OUO47430.1 outer membrane insertion signal [Megasphaera sp. An286]